MGRKSFAETIVDAQLMAKALQENGNFPTGVEPNTVRELERLHEEATRFNIEQEKLKAQLKEKTAQLEATVKNLEDKYFFIKKYVKLGVPQELWKQYGIEDKK